MKKPIREIAYLGIASLVFIFLIGMVFYTDIIGKAGVLSLAGYASMQREEKNNISGNSTRLETITSMEVPQIRYIPRTYKVGEAFSVLELFEIKKAGATEYVPAVSEKECAITICDIVDSKGNSYIVDALENPEQAEEMQAMDYNVNTGIICFHQSGLFRVRILLWGENGRKTRGEITLPVETE